MVFNHLGLFEGIGGFSLAAHWMGWETKAWCEINPFGQQVLRYHFPKAEAFFDIKQSNFEKYKGTIDILTGGFPCQPYSSAGKRLGRDDERHLWPEMLRAIREIQPRWIVGENVLGLVNWDGGLVFHEVQTDLEAAGYEVFSYVLPACAVNAPHKRDRVWFVAYSAANRLQIIDKEFGQVNRIFKETSTGFCFNSFASWSSSKRGAGMVCDGDGLSCELDGITFSKWRKESIKAYGNAIVPQVALQIFKAIEEYETQGLPRNRH